MYCTLYCILTANLSFFTSFFYQNALQDYNYIPKTDKNWTLTL